MGEAVAARDAGEGGPRAGAHARVSDQAQADLVRSVRTLLHKPKLALAHRRQPRQHRRLLVDDGLEEPSDTSGEVDVPQLKVRRAGQRHAGPGGRGLAPAGLNPPRWHPACAPRCMLPADTLLHAPPAPQVTILQRSNASASVPTPAPSGPAPAPAPEPSLEQRSAAALAEASAFVPVSESQYCTTKDGAAVKCSMAFTGSDMTGALVAGQPLYLSFEATELTQVGQGRGSRGAHVPGVRPG